MKALIKFVLPLFIFSCAWNQKELEQLDDFKGSNDEVFLEQIDLDKKVTEKFKVQEPKVVEAPKATAAVVVKPKPVIPTKPKIVVTKKSTVPADYPPELLEFDKASIEIWKKFIPKMTIGESIIYDITYTGIVIGKVAMTTGPINKIQNRDAYQIVGRLKSAPFYSYVYDIDDQVESYIDKEYFTPVKFALVQRESSKKINNLELFDREELKSYYRYRKTKDDETIFKKKDTFIPRYFQDSFSAMFFLRGLPLKVGETYTFPVVTNAKIWLMDINVLGKEKIETAIGTKDSIKLRAITRYTGEVVKKGVIDFWLSDDDKRFMLKFNAEVKIGSVKGAIVSYEVK
ncbi:MAG: DUF3108 domain-containing protein [Bacteriovoracaceae bacterium]|nr:DUF3108 domain-containing protein [Bacteriovoracaceae bacterium]